MAEPRIVVLDTPDEVAEAVVARLVGVVVARPDLVLGLATGGTMLPVYARLVRAFAAGRVSFAGCRSFNLDEYAGLGAGHPASFARFMQEWLFGRTDFGAGRTHLPDGDAADVDAEALRYERAITDAGGIGLQVLGIGANGHIGFNEPGADFGSRTRVVRLAEATRAANRDYFPGEVVPERAITLGIGTILEAGEIVLVATGAHKAAAVAASLGLETIDCPASALRRHANVTYYLDKEASSSFVNKRTKKL